MAINNLPDGLPPVLGEPQLLMKRYISEAWKDAESRFNLKLEFRRDPHSVLEVQRRDSRSLIVLSRSFQMHRLIIRS